MIPSNEEHAQHTYRLYGFYGRELHRWIDIPSRTHGGMHRRFRHNARKPPCFSSIAKYGYDMARKLQIAHLRLDGVLGRSVPAPDLPIWQKGDWIYKRMPNGRVYKKQLNGIPQPRPETYRKPYRREERKPYFTCPNCEGGLKVNELHETETGWIVREQYPEVCVHCGYDLRGACLVASKRKKEWLK